MLCNFYVLRLVNTKWVISLATSDNVRSSIALRTKNKSTLFFINGEVLIDLLQY